MALHSALSLLALLGASVSLASCESPSTGTTVIITADGFRWDYLSRANTPNLDKLVEHGLYVEKMIPTFQTKTFVNYYALATGLHAESSGIVSNTMYDPVTNETAWLGDANALTKSHWWLGEPFWITAELQDVRAGIFFWTGSEAEIKGTRPSLYKKYNHTLPFEDRVSEVLSWLDLPEGERPSVITVYFDEPDSTGHNVGPDHPDIIEQVERIDALAGQMIDGLRTRGLLNSANIMFVSDHGMANQIQSINLGDYIDLSLVTIVDTTPNPSLLSNDPAQLDSILESLRQMPPDVIEWYKRDEVPERFNYNDNVRITPIFGISAPNVQIRTDEESASGGNHGYDNFNDDMATLFIAAGPMFRHGSIPTMRNTDVYEIVCASLGLEPAPNNGSLDAVADFIKPNFGRFGSQQDETLASAATTSAFSIATPAVIASVIIIALQMTI